MAPSPEAKETLKQGRGKNRARKLLSGVGEFGRMEPKFGQYIGMKGQREKF